MPLARLPLLRCYYADYAYAIADAAATRHFYYAYYATLIFYACCAL